MKQFWQALLLVIWLLSQSLGIALPTSHSVATGWLCPTACEQAQSASAYDECSQPFIVYDGAVPRVTTGVLRYRLGPEQVAGVYDTGRVSPFQIAASTPAPAVGKAQFLAAEGGATLADDLAAAATRARNTVGPGSGGAYGTRVHTAFEGEVNALGQGNLFTERSYLNGDLVRRGTPGSVRLDVVNGPLDAPISIFDLKTGGATLTPARIQQIQSHVPGGANVPVFEVRP